MTNNDNREAEFLGFLHNEKHLDPIGDSETVTGAMNYARRLLEDDANTFESIWTEYEEFVNEMDDFYDSNEFKHGVELGKSLESYNQYLEVKKAYEMGEIELWLAYMEPKSMEDWDAWEAEHGKNFDERWKQQKSE
ncbi:hypothetical protein QEH42_gp289 [Microbacterium phage Pumpernickel]|uniref:Uncharacterized protein n=1 Tax=Microbacterium phage Pumpernickel TaxID=2885983 RepID=A0AAE8YBJ9_9CAUD|nr:hypothetical protein QEH42_gp289 [Microbacterium phage Pumpernickel]UDL15929.1 hypothetical protein SEA_PUMPERNICKEL_176 [Microbacterium phage Pumpernickel]